MPLTPRRDGTVSWHKRDRRRALATYFGYLVGATLLLVAWRCEQGLEPVIGVGPARDVLLVFGLLSVAVSVPFMLRPMAWKRLLAYSSLEHMGVVAIGLGFATPLALAGVAVHLVAHAVAKTLGFCLVTPLLAHAPEAARSPVSGIARSSPVDTATRALLRLAPVAKALISGAS